MAQPIRQSDIAEADTERGLYWLGATIIAAIIGFIIHRYGGSVAIVGTIILCISPLGLIMAGVQFYKAKHVPGAKVKCPFCGEASAFLEVPQQDFTCAFCHRRVAVEDGRILGVIEVRCGACGALQKVSERTEVALCEECNHEIPLASSETGHMRHIPVGLAADDDTRPYNLVLVAPGTNVEQLITELQRILAMNRNQVKEVLQVLPATLLKGIPKRKARLLQEQLRGLGAAADIQVAAEA
jgi:hypothetical protein